MTDYHRDTGGPLTNFRTFLTNLENLKPAKQLVYETDENYAATLALMEQLRQDLQKYKKKGSIVCKHCGRVERSHKYAHYVPYNCPGWEEKK